MSHTQSWLRVTVVTLVSAPHVLSACVSVSASAFPENSVSVLFCFIVMFPGSVTAHEAFFSSAFGFGPDPAYCSRNMTHWPVISAA